jgi:hypothetical protein
MNKDNLITIYGKFIKSFTDVDLSGNYPKIFGNLLRDINDYTQKHDILLPTFLIFLLILMIIVGYILFFYNPYKILDYVHIPMIFIYITLFSYILFFTFRKLNDDKYYNLQFEFASYTGNYLRLILLVFSLFIAFYIIYSLVIAIFLTSVNISTTFTIVALVLILAIINSYTGMYAQNIETPILEYIKNLIFYIPCLISDFVDFIKEDYKNTPTTVFILFVILILVTLIYAVSYYLKFKNNYGNIVIIDSPVYLNSNINSISKNELNDKIINSKPFYERAIFKLQEQKTVKYDLSFNTALDAIDNEKNAIPAYADQFTRALYMKSNSEGFTTVMTDETFPIHFTIDDYDKYILQQAMWSNPAINDIIKNKHDAGDGDIGKYINNVVETQKSLMSYYEKTMLYLATFNNSNFSKNFVKDLSNNNYNYSLSFWLYLNPTSTMKGKDKIIEYGNRPSMYFNHGANELTLEMINQPDNTQIVLYRSSNILFQRWNHIVINNNYGEVDLFINSNLVGNYKNAVSYSISRDELLQVGSTENNDIGGIAYMYYYESPLSLKEINDKYINKPSF